MAYTTFDISRLYIFWNKSGYLQCTNCILQPNYGTHYTTKSFKDMARHVQQHIAAGHYHDPDTVTRLLSDGRKYFDNAENIPEVK